MTKGGFLAPSFGAMFLIGMIAVPARAQYTTWTNASGDSNWFNPNNWSTGAVPVVSAQTMLGAQGLTRGGVVDLGGNVAYSDRLFFNNPAAPSSGYSVQNGTLDVNSLQGTDVEGVVQTNNLISANVITGGSTLDIFDAQISGVIGGTGAAARTDFSLSGSGLLSGSNSYTGATTATDPSRPLVFLGEFGSAANSSSIKLRGTLHLDNTAAVNTNRLSSTAPISGDGGAFIFEGNASTPAVELFGVLGLESGTTQITVTSHGPTAAASFQALGRVQNATLDLTLSPPGSSAMGQMLVRDSSSAQLIGGNGPNGSANVSIIPFAISYSPQVSFVTNDPGPDGIYGTADDVGLRPLDLATEYAPLIVPGTNTIQNVRVTGPQTVSDNTAINSLIVSGTTVTVSAGKQLVIGSGAVAMTGGPLTSLFPNTITGQPGASLAFNANAAIFHVATGGTVDVPISGNGGLVKSGSGSLELARANSYTGGTFINQGWLFSAAQGSLSSGLITFAGGTLGFVSSSQTISNDILVNAPASIYVGDGVQAKLTGFTSGGNYLSVNGPSDNAGALRIAGPVNLGSSIYLYGPALYLDGSVTAKTVEVMGGGTIGGTGNINADLKFLSGMNAILSPGDDGPGILTVNSFMELPPTIFHFQLDGTQAGVGYSQLRTWTVGPFATLANVTLDLSLGYLPQPGDEFTLIANLANQPFDEIFKGLPEGSIFSVDGQEFQITYHGGLGNDVDVTAVPEPEAVAILIAGVVPLARRRRALGAPRR